MSAQLGQMSFENCVAVHLHTYVHRLIIALRSPTTFLGGNPPSPARRLDRIHNEPDKLLRISEDTLSPLSGGEYLCFKPWHPSESSHGAIAGANIALVIFAILERLLYATRKAIDARWRRRQEV